MLESKFRKKLKEEIQELFPDCMILPLDPNDTQGIPDLIILHEKKWAALETKQAKNSSRRPNQPYYVDKMNKMSYSAFVSPENKEEILNDLQQSLQPCGATCVSKR